MTSGAIAQDLLSSGCSLKQIYDFVAVREESMPLPDDDDEAALSVATTQLLPKSTKKQLRALTIEESDRFLQVADLRCAV